jgi:DNA polymerase
MRVLHLDFETRSELNLRDVGVDRYASHPSTEILMLAWAFDEDDPVIWLPILGEPMPPELHAGLMDPTAEKWAWNYNFERRVFHHKLGITIPQCQWRDPSVLSAYMSLPIGLDRASKALHIDESNAKISTTGNDRLTKIFCVPSKTRKVLLKKDPTLPPTYFKDWNTHPAEWADFIAYCLGDVKAERAVGHALEAFNSPMPENEVAVWRLDQRINDAGVWIDLPFVKSAAAIAQQEVDGLISQMKELTGVANPNSGHQLGPWLRERGYPFESLDKEHIAEAVLEAKRFKITPLALEVIALKQKLGGSAYSKLETILDRVSDDGRLRDQFVYHGAHTGRWAGRGVQLQNLFKPDPRVSAVLDAVTCGIRERNLSISTIVAEYNAVITAWNAANPTEKPREFLIPFNIMDAVAGTIRSAFAAPPGKKLGMSDLAQIESRVLAALAGCKVMIDAYKNGIDLYKDIMSFLLDKPYDQITKAERARGKVVILGCGFMMGWERFIEHAATFGLEIDEKTAKKYVAGFREKYSEIPAFWKALQMAVIRAIELNICVYVKGLVVDGRNPKMLKIKLPSGRSLHYLNPRVETEETDYGPRPCIWYESWDKKGRQMKKTYGGSLCENVVQAIARDIMVWGMFEAEKLGFLLVMTIHDELVGEFTAGSGLSKKDLEHAMTRTPEWAEGMGFILAAEGDENEYYRK